MNEREYLEFLEAVAVEYIRLKEVSFYMNIHVDDLASTAQLARIVGEQRRENELLQRALGSKLNEISSQEPPTQSSTWGTVTRVLREVGVTEALDQHGEALLGSFRRFAVPEADLDILRQAGIAHPEAALRIAEERARVFAKLAATRGFRASEVLQSAEQELKRAGDELYLPGNTPSKKPQKWFMGISKILAGGAGSLGNVMLGVGVIPGAAPVGAAAVLGSCTGGLVLIGDGIEALRGNN